MMRFGDLEVSDTGVEYDIGEHNNGSVAIDDPLGLLQLHIGSYNHLDLVISVRAERLRAAQHAVSKVNFGPLPKLPPVVISIGNGNYLEACQLNNSFTVGNGTSAFNMIVNIGAKLKSYAIYDKATDKPVAMPRHESTAARLDDLEWWDWNDRKLAEMAGSLNGPVDSVEELERKLGKNKQLYTTH